MQPFYIHNITCTAGFIALVAEGRSLTPSFFACHTISVWFRTRGLLSDNANSEPIEDVELVTMSALINRTTDAHDIPLVAFQAPDFTVCSGVCSIAQGAAILSDA